MCNFRKKKVQSLVISLCFVALMFCDKNKKIHLCFPKIQISIFLQIKEPLHLYGKEALSIKSKTV